MKNYETTCLISPETPVEELNNFPEKLSAFIKEEGGNLITVKGPLKQALRYPIKKKDSSYSITVSFNLEPEKLGNLEKKLKAESQIIRYLILAKLAIKEIPYIKAMPPKEIPIPKEIKKEKRETIAEKIGAVSSTKPSAPKPEKKVELEEIEEKLEEILNE